MIGYDREVITLDASLYIVIAMWKLVERVLTDVSLVSECHLPLAEKDAMGAQDRG